MMEWGDRGIHATDPPIRSGGLAVLRRFTAGWNSLDRVRCSNSSAVVTAIHAWQAITATAMAHRPEFHSIQLALTGTRMSEATTLSPEQQETRRQVRQYILENLMFSNDPTQLPDDASLLDRGIIDSTGVLEVVMFIEESFGVKVHDGDLLPENFDSVARIADFVTRLRSA